MARVDDYQNAKIIAVEQLVKGSFSHICQSSGFETVDEKIFRVPFLNRIYHVSWPDFEFTSASEEDSSDIPLQEQVLILHYMLGKGPMVLSGNWVSYREIPGASFYYSAFVKRAINPLKQVFGNNTAGFKSGAELLNATPIEPGDASFEFQLFPRVPVQLILWEGDEEFPSEANILFDDTIEEILSPEDIAWLAGMVVYRLMALSR